MLIVCNGMMRAGSTLQYNMVRGLMERTRGGTSHGFVHETQFNEYAYRLDAWARETDYHLVKMHSLYPKLHSMNADGTTLICYIFRDIRDVAVSARRKFRLRDKSLLEMLDDSVDVYYALAEMPHVIWQKYENVVANLPLAAHALAASLKISAPATLLQAVADDCSVEGALSMIKKAKMRNRVKYYISVVVSRGIERLTDAIPNRITARLKGTAVGRWNQIGTNPHSLADPQTLLHPDHISKNRGAIGVWRRELDCDEARMLTQRYRGWLLDAGYVP